ncbi:phosphotyrosine protein phosphatase [Pseudohongiella nitratireducens]|jgi:protein-tyrosine phosphatase|uniref:protein-tyrosine-phosphatase n=1 Tax=Pseudohongiella nitratireducens TaxID=1768907 RepID=A0A917GTV0_9GAMM|nr:low molecular weight protein-tyrosine-phosphatase [Pseudohongiella nitratireducens]MDF1622455.1 low molecular weight phosphotyrosine protein phosphatase [Pseudohongiella nitratireducens]GGG56239.1 phosphotyrosine protein phosphatase [Pseudohongiella nitratireducens]|tara:strand:- start:1979 stop:2455 length:477 start_codon:yes stop_codon:yes gene_type:complete
MTTKVLMVCLGNICRSPTAHGIMETLIEKEGLSADIIVDSAGTGDWHIGKAPDPRTQQAAKRRGYDLSHLRARQVTVADLDDYDWVIAMDRQNRQNLLNMASDANRDRITLLLEHAGQIDAEVPDPYYGGEQGFEQVLDMVETACAALLERIKLQRVG